MSKTVLQLENFTFSGFAVPNKMPFGGSQSHVVHKLIGGVRIIDAMGRDDKPLAWSGEFLGPDATDNAKYLDNLRIAGQEITLTWDQFSYQVLIATFDPEWERPYQVPFSITCTIVSDNTTAPDSDDTPNVDDSITDDMQSANQISATVADPQLTQLNASVNSAVTAALGP